jgi:hypothetical protein
LGFTVGASRGAVMIPVQYRDPETEEILERRYEDGAPAIGARVRIGFGEFEVLYRWRCVPTSCIVYVRRTPAALRERVAA